MSDRLNKTSICSVVFLDIVGYSEKSGAEQIEDKDHFNAWIGDAIKDVAQSDRIIVDTGDGAAIALMGAPEEALFVSLTIRDGILQHNKLKGQTLGVRIGINLGPVRVVSDINGRPNIIGDGINVAQRVMSFAEPNQILVSRSYYEVTSRLTKEITGMFSYSGIRQDKHVREHEVYLIRSSADEVPVPMVNPPASSIHAFIAKSGQPAQRKKWLLGIVPVIIAVIGLTVFVRLPSAEPRIAMNTSASPPPVIPPAAIIVIPPPATQTSASVSNAEAKVTHEDKIVISTANTQVNSDKLQLDPASEVAITTDAETPKKKSAKRKKPQLEADLNISNEPVVASVHKPAQAPVKLVEVAAVQSAPSHSQNEERIEDKSGWEKFKDNVQHGNTAKICSQAEMAMGQCH